MPRRARLGFVNRSPQPSCSESSCDEADSDTSMAPAFFRADRYQLLAIHYDLDTHGDMVGSGGRGYGFDYGGWDNALVLEQPQVELEEVYHAGAAQEQIGGTQEEVWWDIFVILVQTGITLVVINLFGRLIETLQMIHVPRRDLVEG